MDTWQEALVAYSEWYPAQLRAAGAGEVGAAVVLETMARRAALLSTPEAAVLGLNVHDGVAEYPEVSDRLMERLNALAWDIGNFGRLAYQPAPTVARASLIAYRTAKLDFPAEDLGRVLPALERTTDIWIARRLGIR
jgi:hypothetical protein